MMPPGGYGGPGAPEGASRSPAQTIAPHQAVETTRAPLLASAPESLAAVPRDQRLVETFGFGLGATAIGALSVAVGELWRASGNGDWGTALRHGGIAAALALGSGSWEIARRLRRTIVVPTVGGIAVYRKGRLDTLVAPASVGRFELRIVPTLRNLMAGGGVGLIGLLGTCVEGGRAINGHLAFAFFWAFAGLVVGGGTVVTTVWHRILCLHYVFPKQGGTEQVALPKSTLRRFGWIP